MLKILSLTKHCKINTALVRQCCESSTSVFAFTWLVLVFDPPLADSLLRSPLVASSRHAKLFACNVLMRNRIWLHSFVVLSIAERDGNNKLSCRSMLRVSEYFAKSLKITQGHLKW